MANIKLNVGMASAFFVTDAKRNIALLDAPYVVFSNSILTKGILSEILMRTYNIEHQKGMFGLVTKQAENESIEKLLDDLINERKITPTLMGTSRPFIIFSKGIEKQCLFSMKILKLRGLSYLVAINIRTDYETIIGSIKAAEEIKNSEIFCDAGVAIHRPTKLRAVIGKHKTVFTTDADFKTILREDPGIITPSQNVPITDKRQLIDEGIYD